VSESYRTTQHSRRVFAKSPERTAAHISAAHISSPLRGAHGYSPDAVGDQESKRVLVEFHRLTSNMGAIVIEK
jgi:hypothetical protein